MQLQGRPKCMALLAKNLAPVSAPTPAAASAPPQGEPPPSLPPSPAHSDGADAPPVAPSVPPAAPPAAPPAIPPVAASAAAPAPFSAPPAPAPVPPSSWVWPHDGELLEVEVEGDDGVNHWVPAEVLQVLVDGQFQALVQVPGDPFEDWFTWEDEGKDWRRPPPPPPRAMPMGVAEAVAAQAAPPAAPAAPAASAARTSVEGAEAAAAQIGAAQAAAARAAAVQACKLENTVAAAQYRNLSAAEEPEAAFPEDKVQDVEMREAEKVRPLGPTAAGDAAAIDWGGVDFGQAAAATGAAGAAPAAEGMAAGTAPPLKREVVGDHQAMELAPAPGATPAQGAAGPVATQPAAAATGSAGASGYSASALDAVEAQRRLTELPDGWVRTTHEAPSGQYKRFTGPNGERAQSLKQVWTIHDTPQGEECRACQGQHKPHTCGRGYTGGGRGRGGRGRGRRDDAWATDARRWCDACYGARARAARRA